MASTENKKELTPSEKAAMLAECADEMKAERIEVMDVRAKTSVTSQIVICSGTSQTHADAIAEKTIEKMRDKGVKPLRRSNNANSEGWILVDYGDVIFHVMLEEKRQFYDLEALWTMLPNDPTLVVEE
jgi:ribosome-associated protein